ncbi:hypothetical protein FRC04_004135 [Tulasnella sp. 424]|nr:hypothetical protein FRC04_004135 [Tulasnella sp. 424]
MDYMSHLPTDLFAPIIFLSFDTLRPVQRIIRTEELRLVNRAWQVAIDSNPCFWTCIPNESKARFSPQEIQRWIRKSGEAPLNILSSGYHLSLREFMPFVIPYIHRWRSLEVTGCHFDISKYINEHAPKLRRLVVSCASFAADNLAFGGVTPSLSSVDLAVVTISAGVCFLKNLKELRLWGVTYQPEEVAVNKLGDILNACPELEQLQLDTNQSLCQPVLLAKLSSFSFQESQRPFERTESILGMIIAPRLADSYFKFEWNWVPSTLHILSPLSTELLRDHGEYDIAITYDHFAVFTTTREGELQPPSRVIVDIGVEPDTWEISIRLLQDFEKAAPPSAPVDLVLDESGPAQLALEYLKSTKESMCGELDNPLPQLRSIQLSREKGNRSSSFDVDLINLARARRNIPKITTYSYGNCGDPDIWVSQLDPESFSFVSVDGCS